MTHPIKSSVALAACLVAGQALAIDPSSASDAMQRSNLRAQMSTPAIKAIPSLYKGEKSDIGPVELVNTCDKCNPVKPHDWFRFSFDIQYLHSSNAFLTNNANVETEIMISTAQLSVVTPAIQLGTGALTLETGYRHQKFNHGSVFGSNRKLHNDLDFDVSTIFAKGYYQLNDDWSFQLGVDYNRIMNTANPTFAGFTVVSPKYKEIYAEVVPSLSANRRFMIDEVSAVNVTVGTAVHYTNADDFTAQTGQNDRIDETLTVSYTRQVCSKTTVQPFYQARFTQYLLGHRKDITQTLGVVVGYRFNEWSSARLYTSFEDRQTSLPGSLPFGAGEGKEYQKWDLGLGGTLSFQF